MSTRRTHAHPGGTAAAPLRSLSSLLEQRPVLVVLAGPNGAGKTTFYHTHLRPTGLRFLNADEFARELGIEAYEAARVVTNVREELVRQRASFVLETVFSDPVGDKLRFLCETAQSGYTVVLCFIGLADPDTSEQRVAMRVSQGGHDVPADKLVGRFPRTLANLQLALRELPQVLVFDNSALATPFRSVAVVVGGRRKWAAAPIPPWLEGLLPEPAEGAR